MGAWARAGWFVSMIAVAGLAGCGRSDAPAGGPGAAPGGQAPPPPEVGVVTVTPRAVGIVSELPGRLESSRVAQVRARTPGIVLQRLFTEGSDVRAGQALFRIDDSAQRTSVASGEANVARAEATVAQATAQAERYRPLVEANAISRQEYVNAQAAQKTAAADVAAARATLQSSRITLGYASVTAPISGRIGRALVTEGALVGQGEATPLAVVQQIDPMYVNFTQPAADVLRLRRAVESGSVRRPGATGDAAEVRIVLEDGSEYPQPGRLLFSDLSVDPSSGQITLRASVPNPRGVLLPGLYVRVKIEQAESPSGLAVPQQAVTRGTAGDTVMVVAADGTFAVRPVKVGSAQGGQWLIQDGLKPGETVIVDGFQKLRGAKTVKPVPWAPPQPRAVGAASAPAGPSAPAPTPAPTPAPASGASR